MIKGNWTLETILSQSSSKLYYCIVMFCGKSNHIIFWFLRDIISVDLGYINILISNYSRGMTCKIRISTFINCSIRNFYTVIFECLLFGLSNVSTRVFFSFFQVRKCTFWHGFICLWSATNLSFKYPIVVQKCASQKHWKIYEVKTTARVVRAQILHGERARALFLSFCRVFGLGGFQ